jgi:hypothetical protein
VLPYARRRGRDALLGLASAGHVSYYRAVMKSDAARSRDGAVGSHTRESWFKLGRTEGTEHHVLREDFYYRAETLTGLAGKKGLNAQLMDDWERLPHQQSKIRVTRRA